MSWRLVFTKQAQKLAAAGLKRKADELLDILRKNPPPYEKLVGDLAGAYIAAHQHSTPAGLSGVRAGAGG